jgi:type I restriction enzyme, R subunit
MAYTDINSEDRLVQAAFAEHLENELGWESAYAWNQETFGETGTLDTASEREVVLIHDLREALLRLNPTLPESGINEAVTKLTHHNYSRSLLQYNQAFHKMIREGVPVSRDPQGQLRHTQPTVIDFR